MLTYFVPVFLTISTILVLNFTVCQELELSELKISEHEELFYQLQTENNTNQNELFKIIFPGTRWCGDGNIAKDEEELGYFRDTDTCCREHDHCPYIILSGETKYNFTNTSPYTRLSCSCEEIFYKCLTSQCSPVAAAIGITYFDILKPTCFTYDHPANCTEKESDETFGERCINYKVNMDQPKIWQWRESMKFDLSKTSTYFLKCFKDATLDRMKTTGKQILQFIYKYGVKPLIKLCNTLAPDSWFRKYICPKNSANRND